MDNEAENVKPDEKGVPAEARPGEAADGAKAENEAAGGPDAAPAGGMNADKMSAHKTIELDLGDAEPGQARVWWKVHPRHGACVFAMIPIADQHRAIGLTEWVKDVIKARFAAAEMAKQRVRQQIVKPGPGNGFAQNMRKFLKRG